MTVEPLSILTFALTLGIGVAVLLHWRDTTAERRQRDEQRQAEKQDRERERAEHENWRYKEVEPMLQRLMKMEGILLGLNGDNGLRADVRRLSELRSEDASRLQRLDLQAHLLLEILVDSSPDEEARKRLQALSGSFVVNPP